MKKLIDTIKSDGVVILPTDTLYGLHASVFSKRGVDKIYKLKNRETSKPLIILINSWNDLDKLNIKINDKIKEKLKQWWPGSLSVILPCNNEALEYLHRGANSLAIRWPDYPLLNSLLKQTGPLVSTTVNMDGEQPVESIIEAKKLFGDRVDGYLDDGLRMGLSSTLIKFDGDNIKILREGAVKL